MCESSMSNSASGDDRLFSPEVNFFIIFFPNFWFDFVEFVV